MNLKSGLLVAAIAILAVVATIGWTRGRETANQPTNGAGTYVQPAPAYDGGSQNYNGAAQPYNVAPQPYYPNAAAASYSTNGPILYSQDQPEAYVNLIHRPVVIEQRPAPAPVYSAPPPPAYYGPAPAYVGEPRREVVRERVYVEDRDRHHHHRSTKKSVAIVAGSAGAGAAVGALAGGGKGAGIGALAGGAGGFIYDRLTHNH